MRQASLRRQFARCARSTLRPALAAAALASVALAQGQGGEPGNSGHAGEPGNVPGVMRPYRGAGDTVAPSGSVPTSSGGGTLTTAPTGPAGVGGPVIAAPPIDIEALNYFLERDENDWRIWWRLNRDPLLVVDPSQVLPMSTDGGFYLGEEKPDTTRVVTSQMVQALVLPKLEQALASETSPAVQSAILIALGRAGALVSDATARRVLELVAHPDRSVCEAAIVAAGLQARPEIVGQLVHVVHGCEAGSDLLGGRASDQRLASFAALSIGLGAHRHGDDGLRRFVAFDLARTASLPSAAPDVPVACVAAVGLLPLPWKGDSPEGTRSAPHASREGQLVWLLQAAASEDVHGQVSGHAARALGRLAEGAPPVWREHVASALLAMLDERSDVRLETRQGAAVALGDLGDCDEDELDRRVRRALMRASREGDPLTRRFALVSIGRVAARDGTGEGLPDADRRELVAHLMSLLTRGRAGLDAWAALTLGVLQHQLIESGHTPDSDVQDALAAELEDCRTPTTAGAYALGLALSSAPGAGTPLAEAFERFAGDEPAAAAIAIALGFAGGPAPRSALIDLVETARGRPAVLHDASLGIALTGDFDGTPRLLEAFRATTALDSRAALASALGRTGDTRAIEPLLAALTDASAPQGSRALAARGLGWLVDQGYAPIWSALSCDLNWGADTSTLSGVEGGDYLAFLRDF
jgi:HEAT repeat protein